MLSRPARVISSPLGLVVSVPELQILISYLAREEGGSQSCPVPARMKQEDRLLFAARFLSLELDWVVIRELKMGHAIVCTG